MSDDTKKLISEEIAPAVIEQSAKLALAQEIPLIGPLFKILTFLTGRNARNADAASREEMDNIIVELCGRMEAVEEKLKADGKEPEHLNPLAARLVVEELLEAIGRTVSATKREALINLAARMTDPTAGTMTTRRSMWRLLEAIPEAEFDILVEIGKSSDTEYIERELRPSIRRDYPNALLIKPTDWERSHLAEQLGKWQPRLALRGSARRDGTPYERYRLTPPAVHLFEVTRSPKTQ